MLESFFNFLKYEKRVSEYTIISYSNDLLQFKAFLSERFSESLENAKHLHIRAWIVSLMEQSLSPRSVNRKIASLKSFYHFLIKRGHIEEDPLFKIKSLKTEKKLPIFIQEKELSMLLDQLSFEESFEGIRDKLIIELLYNTGIRLSELINLTEKNVNLTKNHIKVLGKRNKERIIPFSNAFNNIITQYTREKIKCFKNNETKELIVTNAGKTTYPMFIYRVVKKYLSQVTTENKKSPHVLRHTFATHLLNKGADINAVKELLGHTSLVATQIYTHNSIRKLKDMHKQAHPKA